MLTLEIDVKLTVLYSWAYSVAYCGTYMYAWCVHSNTKSVLKKKKKQEKLSVLYKFTGEMQSSIGC